MASLDEWILWYESNRPRLEGSADVQRQLAFVLKALDGQWKAIVALREAQRQASGGPDSVVQIPRLVGRLP